MNHQNIAVEVKNLSRHFDHFVAVDGISFAVKQGEIFGFLGPNGAGKSTTIKMLCGILLPTSGSARVAGYDINTQPELVKAHIGYMSQKFSLYQYLKAKENLEFYAGVYGVPLKERFERIREVAQLTGISQRLNDPTAILTGGWRQRLALAAALVHNPPILFLDEPTSGVDPNSRRSFWDLIQELAQRGTTIFITTHYLEEAEYCNRLALIHKGSIVAQGSPKELKASFPYPILSLEVSPLVQALSLLGAEPSLGDISIWGDSLHVVLREGESSKEKALQILKAAGVKLLATESVEPTLEDIFVLKTSAQAEGETYGC
jgi:ABC-2 type transport system ATP-binding protein